MNKKVILAISGIILVLLVLVFVLYPQFNRGKNSVQSPISVATPTLMQEELATWTDPAEFSFQYPKSLNINPHDEDKINYAHVELTTDVHPGNLIVWVKDATVQTIDAWITQQKITNAIDSTLDGFEAKKVLATGEKNTITLSTLRNGYLYQIEVNPTDEEYWNKIFDQLISNFKFITGDDNSTSSKTSGDLNENVSEGEEVIE